MIIYKNTKAEFVKDCLDRDIDEILAAAYTARTGRRVGSSEKQSWKNSLVYMARTVRDEMVPNDCGVALEYSIPQTSNRIDVLFSGFSVSDAPQIVIVELKQWTEARATEKDGVVIARFHGRAVETDHPSYQAWSYMALLEGYNEAVYEGDLALQPCAYLHNYVQDADISDSFYGEYLQKAPLFYRGEEERRKLRDFLAFHLRRGDLMEGIYTLENGRIRPSKGLADAVVGMIAGNPEFILIGAQKVVYETALAAAKTAEGDQSKKQVMIVKGGPGTGKSVVAINLLGELTKRRLNCRYVSKNAAPRAVYKAKLTKTVKRSRVDALFSGSGAYMDWDRQQFDVLIVDEAHRLNAKSGFYGNQGENQIKELINASKCTIFLLTRISV